MTNLSACTTTMLPTTFSNKESASSPEDSSSSLLDMDLEDPLSLSSVESVVVSTPRLLMSVPILSERPCKTSRRMISRTQELLPITSVITLVILLVWDLIFSDLLLSPHAPPLSLVLLPTNLFKLLMLSSSQSALPLLV